MQIWIRARHRKQYNVINSLRYTATFTLFRIFKQKCFSLLCVPSTCRIFTSFIRSRQLEQRFRLKDYWIIRTELQDGAHSLEWNVLTQHQHHAWSLRVSVLLDMHGPARHLYIGIPAHTKSYSLWKFWYKKKKSLMSTNWRHSQISCYSCHFYDGSQWGKMYFSADAVQWLAVRLDWQQHIQLS